MTGPGTGLDPDGVVRKTRVVREALARHGDTTDAMQALARLGGGEIAFLVGLAIGAGEYGLGYVCDGVIATAAAAVAVELAPGLADRMIAGHRSPEPAHALLLDRLGLEPVVDLKLRLGEASGALVALGILRLAAAAHCDMATFHEAGIAD